jgi:DnaJ-class molecular chaperone
MKLGARKIIRANTLFAFLNTQTKEFLIEHKLSRCEECNGRGIVMISDFWNGTDFCEECNGIGFKGLQIEGGLKVSDTLYLCKNCAGLGCHECEEKGVVDWIRHAMGVRNV